MYNRIDGDGLLYLLQLVWADISVRPELSSLATVATSGSYTDLLNKPEIPSISTSITSGSDNTTAAGTLAVYNFVMDAVKKALKEE